jgi:hypothetical protein
MDQVVGSSSREILAPPVPGGHGLTTRERQQTDHSSNIKGWGSDLDPQKRPARQGAGARRGIALPADHAADSKDQDP